jgi:hypothetical protein
VANLTTPRSATIKYDVDSVLPQLMQPLIAAGVVIYEGALVTSDAEGKARPGGIGVSLGRAIQTVDNRVPPSSGPAPTILVEPGCFAWSTMAGPDAVSLATTPRGAMVFIADDHTVARTDGGGTRSPAGYFVDENPLGGVFVQTGLAGIAGGVTASSSAALAQAAWYIDPAAGSDSNGGELISDPIKTDRERQDRLGIGGVIDNPSNRLDIYFLSNMSPTDPLDLSEQTVGLDMVIYVHGTATTVRTGTFTAVTPIDNTNAGTGGNMLLLTDSAGPAVWVAKQRVTIVGGPRDGARGWVQKPIGGGQAAFSTFAFPAEAVLDFALTEVTPQVGDAYKVESLSTVYLTEQTVRSQGHASALFTRLMFVDCHIAQGTFTNWLVLHSSEGLSPFILDACLVDPIVRSPGSSIQFMNCYVGGGILSIYGGVLVLLGGVFISSVCIIEEGSKLLFDQNVYVTGAGAIKLDGGSRLVIGSAGFFDMTDPNTAACVIVYPGCTVQVGEQSIAQFDGKALFGNGNAGRIFDIQPNASVEIEATCPVVARGVGAEFNFDGDAHGWWFDDATAAYGPAGGIATSFANLAIAAPAGFGGDAHHPRKNAHVLRTTKHT